MYVYQKKDEGRLILMFLLLNNGLAVLFGIIFISIWAVYYFVYARVDILKRREKLFMPTSVLLHEGASEQLGKGFSRNTVYVFPETIVQTNEKVQSYMLSLVGYEEGVSDE